MFSQHPDMFPEFPSQFSEHARVLDAFKLLPKEIRKHIQTFHKSKLPNKPCQECRRPFYFWQLRFCRPPETAYESCCGRLCPNCKTMNTILWLVDSEEQYCRDQEDDDLYNYNLWTFVEERRGRFTFCHRYFPGERRCMFVEEDGTVGVKRGF